MYAALQDEARSLAARPGARGFTLIELMLGITIMAVVLAFGLPSMYSWLQSSQIRNATEAIQNGLQVAKAEAVRRNVEVQFTFTALTTTGSSDWSVTCVSPNPNCPGTGMTPSEIQKYPATEGAPSAHVTSTQAAIIFNGMGRVTPIPGATIAIDITNPNAGTCAASGGNIRCLRLQVSQGGHIKMCDPALPVTNPRGC